MLYSVCLACLFVHNSVLLCLSWHCLPCKPDFPSESDPLTDLSSEHTALLYKQPHSETVLLYFFIVGRQTEDWKHRWLCSNLLANQNKHDQTLFSSRWRRPRPLQLTDQHLARWPAVTAVFSLSLHPTWSDGSHEATFQPWPLSGATLLSTPAVRTMFHLRADRYGTLKTDTDSGEENFTDYQYGGRYCEFLSWIEKIRHFLCGLSNDEWQIL